MSSASSSDFSSTSFAQSSESTTSSRTSIFPPSPCKPASGNRDIAKDRFNPDTGARLVAGVVVLSNLTSHPSEVPHKYVLCVSSSRHPNKVVLPKGGWEYHESVEEAALRECWEEAGVVGTITKFLLKQADSRPPKGYSASDTSTCTNGNGQQVTKYKGLDVKGQVTSRSEYQYFQVEPTQVFDDWPEADKRIRKWLTYGEAQVAFRDRGEMAQSLELSDILKRK
ncbi:Diphosphoinositol polyphosphate phosphohydrolase aps1 [Taphrina deformans PYCC 5710]|uniref:Diphosphoinositol polyphosphate phosphohydrolase aps1 n=1 Tax=Taphrina deformans (strain PYCC 5710 / ATCC 11124 / CBS 356.35 / IMI 108563 / JCM 9778 / NBRC 8474) TaxID=1097556 RepID=R4X6Q9_TAPDE|nr:Diphosphoinositol polyphosphate phosphohydrolase aps1 [Taphrina deformans PYCC 5710]|eukprot:CCG80596.1 Diphosphoinositol polyphosphate phosphohydrolase aps1 [Taphrina deformans PYCC 5710]